MDTLPLVTWMFALTASGALIWLTIRAFKTNTMWGFAVLLLSPFSATFFGVKHWKEQSEPFLLYITTFTATFALGIYLFTVSGGLELLHFSANLQRGTQVQTLAENNNGNLMHASFSVERTSGMDGRFQQGTGVIDEHVSEEITGIPGTKTQTDADFENEAAMKKEKPVRYRLTYVPIKISEARNYIGTTAKITRKNVPEKEYRITGASRRHIELAQRGRGGQYSFHFRNSDVEKIRVLVNKPY